MTNADTRLKLLIGELQFQNAIFASQAEEKDKRIAELEEEVRKFKEPPKE